MSLLPADPESHLSLSMNEFARNLKLNTDRCQRFLESSACRRGLKDHNGKGYSVSYSSTLAFSEKVSQTILKKTLNESLT